MCDRCEGAKGRRAELTEETYGLMMHETTHVALQAAAACANQWPAAARGFLADMSATWGPEGMTRMAYVWGAARYFLPAPPEWPDTPGGKELTPVLRHLLGHELEPDDSARLVAMGDQLGAACNAVAEAASKGDPEGVAEALWLYGQKSQAAMNALFYKLMADTGIRLRYSRDSGAETAHDLFRAHIHADLPEEEEEEERGGGGA